MLIEELVKQEFVELVADESAVCCSTPWLKAVSFGSGLLTLPFGREAAPLHAGGLKGAIRAQKNVNRQTRHSRALCAEMSVEGTALQDPMDKSSDVPTYVVT